MANRSRIVFVVNPISGRARGRRGRATRWAVELLRLRLREAGADVSTAETLHPGSAEEITAMACRDGARAVVVVGGDGTINNVVRGMTGDGLPILIIPAGTENVLAKYLGIKADGELLWRVLQEGVERRIDVAEVRARDDSGQEVRRRFLLMGGAGFDAAMVLGVSRRRTELVRRGGGQISRWTYLPVAVKLLLGFHHPSIRVEADGDLIESGQAQVFVGNVPRYAIGLQPWGDARPDDGILEAAVFGCRHNWDLIRHFLAVLFRAGGNSKGAVRRGARHLRVTSVEPGVPVQVDGDFVGWLPAEFSLIGNQARFLVPR